MTKRTLPLSLLVVWLVAGTVGAASDPFVGAWKLNPAKSSMTDRLKVEAAGSNTYAFSFGDAMAAETVVADGTDQPGQFGSTLAVTVGGPDTWTVVRKMNGRELLTATWKLSADGRTFTDAMSSHRPDGSTMSMDIVYKRTTAGSGFVGGWESTSEQMHSTYVLQVQPYENDGLSFVFPTQQRNVKFDGKDYPDTGQNAIAGSTSSGRRVNERTLEMAGKINGKAMGTEEITLSPDLKILTITVHPKGQSKPNMYVFEREEKKGTS